MTWMNRILPLALGTLGLAAWPGCEAHVRTDAPPPARVEVETDRPVIDVDVDRKPGVDVDVDVNRPNP